MHPTEREQLNKIRVLPWDSLPTAIKNNDAEEYLMARKMFTIHVFLSKNWGMAP